MRSSSRSRKATILEEVGGYKAYHCFRQAQMESAYALDFVSLLLSKHTPRQADLTMSPYLKQNVPSGSLGVEVMQLPQVSEAEQRDAKLVSTGWKLQSLNDTADSLLRSATRLEKEMEQEARYWEQVLAVKEKGWSICRLPQERHTLGVRYGFAEGSTSNLVSSYLMLMAQQLLWSFEIVVWPPFDVTMRVTSA